MEVVEMRLEVANGNDSDARHGWFSMVGRRDDHNQNSNQNGKKGKLGALAVGTAYC